MPDDDLLRIAVVDDHPLMRGGIVQFLAGEPGLSVVAEGETADMAVHIAQTALPDIMLLDINLPGGGLDALRRISASCPAVAVVIITVREDEDTVAQALRDGAKGYVLKGVSGQELARTIRAVADGEVYITPHLAARLLTNEAGRSGAKQAQHGLELLTVREREILALIAKGMPNKEIAAAIELSEKTIKHYVTNILQKLQVRNRVEAALLANR